jgi:hypothetical protein
MCAASATFIRIHDWAVSLAAATRPGPAVAERLPSEFCRTESGDLGDLTHFYVSAQQVSLRLHHKCRARGATICPENP